MNEPFASRVNDYAAIGMDRILNHTDQDPPLELSRVEEAGFEYTFRMSVGEFQSKYLYPAPGKTRDIAVSGTKTKSFYQHHEGRKQVRYVDVTPAEFSTPERRPDAVDIIDINIPISLEIGYPSGKTETLTGRTDGLDPRKILFGTSTGIDVIEIKCRNHQVVIRSLNNNAEWRAKVEFTCVVILTVPNEINDTSAAENKMTTNHNVDVSADLNQRLEEANEAVTTTDLMVSGIINQFGLNPSTFYRQFRAKYGGSPKEYREARGPIGTGKIESGEDKIEEPVKLGFTIDVVHHEHIPIMSAPNAYSIPIVVNEKYGFLVRTHVTSGELTSNSPQEFLRSEYREEYNRLVVEKLRPYFQGRLDIAYLQYSQSYQGYNNFQTPPTRFGGVGGYPPNRSW